jgi:NAD(P)-dependent dehydrogenase (short-subunit alcohol dehydrogenase family)
MKELTDRVAVVTGAASGIGRGLAERFAAEGMKVVLADIETGALAETKTDLEAKGATVLAVETDVSKAGDVEALAKKTIDAFGAVHVVCNNAGVAVGGLSWERTLADWQWVMGVNLWGVIHGIRVFVPIMLEQDTEGHVVNTASTAGLSTGPGLPIYTATKHAVVALSEVLHHEFAVSGAKLRASVLCPLYVDTRIVDSARNRPAELQNDPALEARRSEMEPALQAFRQTLASGDTPAQIADAVFNAIRDEKFYVINDPRAKDGVRSRMKDILEDRNPALRPSGYGATSSGTE